MTKKKMDKTTSLKIHAKNRAKERHGLNFNHLTRKFFLDEIKKGNSTFIKKESNRRTVHQIKYKEKFYLVIYDKLRGQIITFLPDKNNIENQNQGE